MKSFVLALSAAALLGLSSLSQAACESKGDRGIELRRVESPQGSITVWEVDRIERRYSPVSNMETLIVDIKADGDIFFSAPAHIDCGANRRYFTNGLNDESMDKPLAPKDLLQQVEKRFCLKNAALEYSRLGGVVLSVGKDKKGRPIEWRTRRAVWFVNYEEGKRAVAIELEKDETGQPEYIKGKCDGGYPEPKAAFKKAASLFCPCPPLPPPLKL